MTVHEGRVVMVRHHGSTRTAGYVAECETCEWTSSELRTRGETTLKDLHEHIRETANRPQETDT